MIFWTFLAFSIDNYSLRVLYKLKFFLEKLVNFLTKKKDQSLILYISCEYDKISLKTLK